MKIINNFYFGVTDMSQVRTQLVLLLAAVAANTSITESAITLLNGLGEQIKAATVELAEAGADTSTLVDITNQITAESATIAAAIQANTPTASEPAVDISGTTEATDPAATITDESGTTTDAADPAEVQTA